MKGKVFVVGMFRTGTTSVAHAVAHFGYYTSYQPWFVLTRRDGVADNFIEDRENWPQFYPAIRERAEKYDAFSDAPWLFLYPELDEWYPGSKFILTLRTPAKVAASERNQWQKHFAPKDIPSAAAFMKRYNDHVDAVRRHFRGRPCYLEMCLERGDGWAKLAPFLGKPVPPRRRFPHMNKAKYRR